MEDGRDTDKPEGTTDPAIERRRSDYTRRALLRAGWVVPVVSAVNIPSAFAQSAAPHTDHTDHVDVPHTDVVSPHSDVVADPHNDVVHTDHADHVDAPHQDHQDHLDSHADAHTDSHVDVHTDVHSDVTPPHADVPHVDLNVRP